jgi:hypothetical protein
MRAHELEVSRRATTADQCVRYSTGCHRKTGTGLSFRCAKGGCACRYVVACSNCLSASAMLSPVHNARLPILTEQPMPVAGLTVPTRTTRPRCFNVRSVLKGIGVNSAKL